MFSSNFRKPIVVLVIFSLLGFLLSFKALSSPLDKADMDAYSRANGGYEKYINGQLLDFRNVRGPWLPLHSSILGFSSFFIPDPQLAPRIITLIFSVLSIPLMFIYVGTIFEKHPQKNLIQFVATTTYLFHPFRLILSTQPLSESISMFFFLLLLVLATRKRVNSFLVVIFINLASAIRFEFWLMIPIIWHLFLKTDADRRTVIMSSLACLAFPIYWYVLNFFYYENFFGFFLEKYYNAQLTTPQIPYYNLFLSTKEWISTLLELTGVVGFSISIYGGVKYFLRKQKNYIIFTGISFYFFFSLIIQVFFGTMEWLAPRYLFPVFISLIPFFSYGLVTIVQTSIRKRGSDLLFFVAIILYLFWFLEILGLIKNITNWKWNVSNYELDQVKQLTQYYELNKQDFSTKKIFYVTRGDWLMPMFIYLTQRHDVKFISPSEYLFYSYSKKSSLYILKKTRELTTCPGNSFENNYFIVCSY